MPRPRDEWKGGVRGFELLAILCDVCLIELTPIRRDCCKAGGGWKQERDFTACMAILWPSRRRGALLR